MKREYKVRIKLKTNNIWDTSSRVEEVREIREWVEQQCSWDPDNFEIKFHSMGNVMDVWFEHEQDAVMCTLRWA
jgi:hypothetical protein